MEKRLLNDLLNFAQVEMVDSLFIHSKCDGFGGAKKLVSIPRRSHCAQYRGELCEQVAFQMLGRAN